MSDRSSFDCLPLELFYEVFSYLSGGHILQAFHSLNARLNAVLAGYDGYLLDLSSSDISKNEFDLACSFLRAEQIAGLKMGYTQFGLVSRFLWSFCNQQPFTRLRSLWIDETIKVTHAFLKTMKSWIRYNQLISIRFDRIDLSESIIISRYSFASLARLVACSSACFHQLSIEIPTTLTSLHMFFNSVADLDRYLRPNMHQLKSLSIGIQCDPSGVQQLSDKLGQYQWTHLVQFNLNLTVETDVRFETLRGMLSSMYQLKYFILILTRPVNLDSDVLNGILWESYVSTSLARLKTFNFKFSLAEGSDEQVRALLKRFRSAWWLDEKQWFVGYDYSEKTFFTVPYFAPTSLDSRYAQSLGFRVNPHVFYRSIDHLSMDLVWYASDKRIFRKSFERITRLSLHGRLTDDVYDQIRGQLNLHMLKDFEFTSTENTTVTLVQLLENMSNLWSLRLQYAYSQQLFDQIASPRASIRRLTLVDQQGTRRWKQLLSRLSQLFPRLTELTTNYDSRDLLCYLLNKLIHLEKLTLYLSAHQHVPRHVWIEEHSRLRMHSFESKVFNTADREKRLVLWINSDSNVQTSWHQQTRRSCTLQ